MKSTPGPWQISDAFDDGNGCVVENGTRMICECYEDGEPSTDEDRANARLIAAAPDLLAALEKIAEVCNGYGDEAGWACKHALIAIAKADGRDIR